MMTDFEQLVRLQLSVFLKDKFGLAAGPDPSRIDFCHDPDMDLVFSVLHEGYMYSGWFDSKTGSIHCFPYMEVNRK